MPVTLNDMGVAPGFPIPAALGAGSMYDTLLYGIWVAFGLGKSGLRTQLRIPNTIDYVDFQIRCGQNAHRCWYCCCGH